MTARDVVVVRTGAANTASVMAAFERLGARPRIDSDPLTVRRAPFVVLPGVGRFGAVAARLDRDLRVALRRRIDADRPTLGICLGLQLFAAASEESPGARGLALLPDTVRRLPAGVRVPQLGWNRVEPESSEGLLEPGWAYFANSYALQAVPPPWRPAHAEHGRRFVAAFEHGRVLACQFHPELSGRYGRDLLARWLEGGAA